MDKQKYRHKIQAPYGFDTITIFYSKEVKCDDMSIINFIKTEYLMWDSHEYTEYQLTDKYLITDFISISLDSILGAYDRNDFCYFNENYMNKDELINVWLRAYVNMQNRNRKEIIK